MPVIGQIVVFAGAFNGTNERETHDLSSGQILSISQNEALFGLIGTT